MRAAPLVVSQFLEHIEDAARHAGFLTPRSSATYVWNGPRPQTWRVLAHIGCGGQPSRTGCHLLVCEAMLEDPHEHRRLVRHMVASLRYRLAQTN